MRKGIFECSKCVLLTTLAAMLQADNAHSQDFQPKFEAVEISGLPNRAGSISLRDSITLGEYNYGVDQGKYRIDFTEHAFVCRNIETSTEIWSRKKQFDENTEYHFLKCTADEVLFGVYPSSTKERKFETPPGPCRLIPLKIGHAELGETVEYSTS